MPRKTKAQKAAAKASAASAAARAALRAHVPNEPPPDDVDADISVAVDVDVNADHQTDGAIGIVSRDEYVDVEDSGEEAGEYSSDETNEISSSTGESEDPPEQHCRQRSLFKRKRAPYRGTSERTMYRRQAATKHAKWVTNNAITNYFRPANAIVETVSEANSSKDDNGYLPDDPNDGPDVPPDPDLPPLQSDSDVDVPQDDVPSQSRRRQGIVTAEHVADIKRDIAKKKNLPNNGEEVLWLRAILSYWTLLLRKVRGGKERASRKAAEVLLDGGVYAARKIRRFASTYLRTGEVPTSQRGAHSKVMRVIDIPFVRDDVLAHLDERRRTCPAAFAHWLNQYLVNNGFSTVTTATARAWMKLLGFKKQHHKKGVYYDGHDREDVQDFLHKEFIPALDEIERRRRHYFGDDMEEVIMPEDKSQPEVILAYHDECVFFANNVESSTYARDGDQELPKKGQGGALHVSDFVTEVHGFLDLQDNLPAQEFARLKREGKLPANLKSRVIIYPGKNHDGWWDCKQLMAQCEHFLDIFEMVHPGAICMVVFDCSSNHQAFADDALVASRMNVHPGGKQPKMRDTTFVPVEQRHIPTDQQEQVAQTMVFGDDHPQHPGKPKGMLAVAQERGLVKPGKAPMQRCSDCKSTAVKDPLVVNCCLTRMLSVELDFTSEQSALQKLVESRGHLCKFLPKFHCELNPIECAWCAAKFTCRRECDYSFPHLKDRVPRVLDQLPIASIRRWFRLSDRFRDSYKRGLTGRLADFAVRKYKSHRRLPDSIVVKELEEEFKLKKK